MDFEIIRVFPHRNNWTPTDGMAFIGEPPLFRPGDRGTPVRVSVTFTWHKREAERLAAMWSHYYGFPGMRREQFIAMFMEHNGCEPFQPVTRIEFEYVEEEE